MEMKVKTPEELAKSEQNRKGPVTFYLETKLVTEVKERASKAGISTSKLVNEAISTYLQALKKNS